MLIVAIGGILFLLFWTQKNTNLPTTEKTDNLDFLQLPQGFTATIFAQNLGDNTRANPGPNNGPRILATYKNTVFVSLMKQGKVVALFDKNNDGFAETRKTVIENLQNPHGLAFYQDWLYIAEEHRVIRVQDPDNDDIANLETLEELVLLPSGDGHVSRTIKILEPTNAEEGEEAKLFISIGSSCNVCNEKEQQRATIQACDLDGQNCQTYARGLRNSVGFAAHEGKIYATENSRDLLGDLIPPDEINLIEEGRNYGWPICYGKNIHDGEFDTNTYIRNPCLEPFEAESFVDLDAHNAPLGLSFYKGTKFPQEFADKLFVALHGSWNSSTPVGYKIITVDLNTKEINDFLTGWLNPETGEIYGRPVDILNYKNGLLISDDNAGNIYFINYQS